MTKQGRVFQRRWPQGSAGPRKEERKQQKTIRQVTFVVVEGEHENAIENNLIGSLFFDGIPPGPKGGQNIQVEVTLDVSGIITLYASNSNVPEKKFTIWNGLPEE